MLDRVGISTCFNQLLSLRSLLLELLGRIFGSLELSLRYVGPVELLTSQIDYKYLHFACKSQEKNGPYALPIPCPVDSPIPKRGTCIAAAHMEMGKGRRNAK